MGKNRHREIWLLVLLLVSLFLLTGLFALNAVRQFATETSNYSARSWLRVMISEALQEYYKTHRCYPSKLADLQISFPGDGADLEMLKEFKYNTDGKSMSWCLSFLIVKRCTPTRNLGGKEEGCVARCGLVES